MQTVLLAAGDGRRLRPLTATTPKPLLPVGGDPIACTTARAAVAAGASALSVVVPPDHGAFVDSLGRSVGDCPVEYVVQPRPTGTAEAVRRAVGRFDGPFAVLPGDCLTDVASLERLFASTPGVGVVPAADAAALVVGDGGDPSVDDGEGHSATTRPRTGACSLPAGLDDLFEPAGVRGSRPERLLDRAAGLVDMTPVEHGYCVDVDLPEDLLRANALAFREWGDAVASTAGDDAPHGEGVVSEGATIEGPVRIDAGARIGRGALVRGPCVVGRDATVEAGGRVGPATYLGPDVVVGRDATVAESVLLAGTRLGGRCSLVRALIGRSARLGPNTTVPPRASDRSTLPGTHTDRDAGDPPATPTSAPVVLGARVRTAVDTTIERGATMDPGRTTELGAVVTRDDS